jgi:hypothetical protein
MFHPRNDLMTVWGAADHPSQFYTLKLGACMSGPTRHAWVVLPVMPRLLDTLTILVLCDIVPIAGGAAFHPRRSEHLNSGHVCGRSAHRSRHATEWLVGCADLARCSRIRVEGLGAPIGRRFRGEPQTTPHTHNITTAGAAASAADARTPSPALFAHSSAASTAAALARLGGRITAVV